MSQILLRAEISFSSLDRSIFEQQLDLLEFVARRPTQLRESANAGHGGQCQLLSHDPHDPYGTGVRRAQYATLKLTDIDLARLVVHVQGGKDRDTLLSPHLRDELRADYR